MEIWNEDCVEGSKKRIADASVDLIICDPPFGINESTFDDIYKRNKKDVLDGYVEAPENSQDYYNFTKNWMSQAYRILKPSGTFYIISGWSHLKEILVSADELKLLTLNHCIWKFNFGVNTTTKFVTSHYHVLRFAKTEKVIFNTYCRFGPQEKSKDKKSLLYGDLEDVFIINKEYIQNETKNKNKLPEELIQKLILYSSNEGDLVCDFFMGNFTTATVANGLGREVIGFELNKHSYDHWISVLSKEKKGDKLQNLKQVEVILPENQGKSISNEERKSIEKDYKAMMQCKSKNDTIQFLMKKYGRGKFSIINIVESIEWDKPIIHNFFSTE